MKIYGRSKEKSDQKIYATMSPYYRMCTRWNETKILSANLKPGNSPEPKIPFPFKKRALYYLSRYTIHTTMDQRIITAFFLILACAIALSFFAHIFAVFPFDLKISHELQEEKNPVFALSMQGVSAIGDTWIGIVIVVAVSAFFIARGQLLEAGFILATLSSFVLISLVKVLVARPRPPDFFQDPSGFLESINQYSFPSGHVLFFVVFFGFIAYLAWRNQTGLARFIVIAVCSALVILIAPSRIYLGAHWASDVLGSYIIGILWLFVLILGYQLVSRKRTTGLMDD